MAQPNLYVEGVTYYPGWELQDWFRRRLQALNPNGSVATGDPDADIAAALFRVLPCTCFDGEVACSADFFSFSVADGGGGSVDVLWSVVSPQLGYTGYIVQRRESGETAWVDIHTEAVAADVDPNTDYTYNDPAPGAGTWEYRITATGGGGEDVSVAPVDIIVA